MRVLRGGAQRLRIVLVEGVVDAAQHSFQGNPSLAPGFDQSPVQRGQHQQRAAPLLKPFFDLGKVVEVILHALFYSLARTVERA